MKAKNKLLRRALSFVLSLALVLGNFAGTGLSVYAEEETTVETAVSADKQVAYYSFDDVEGTAVKDRWGSRDGVLAEGAATAEGKVGNALSVTTAGAGMTFADDLTNLDDVDWTICYWANHTTDLSGEVSVTEDADQKYSTALRVGDESNRTGTGFRVGDNEGDVLTYRAAMPAANEWHHYAWSQDKDGVGLAYYIDGVLINTINWTVSHAVKAPVDIIGGTGFTGLIDEVKLFNTALTADEVAQAMKIEGEAVPGGSNISTLFNNDPDNSWVFTGGRAVEGGFEDVRGARNFVGHFEEYIRNTKRDSTSVATEEMNRQRHMINTAREGQTLADIVANWEDRVGQFVPQAIAYMAGAEDYNAGSEGIGAFKENLKSFINKALAEKDGTGIAVIQTPYAVNDEAANANIEAYIAAINEVVSTYAEDAEKYANILVVDHYESTKDNSTFKTTMIEADGNLNILGHYEIGRLLSAGTIKTTSGYPAASYGVKTDAESNFYVEYDQPDNYLDVQPEITSEGTALTVVIPEGNGTAWNYELDMEGLVISGTADSNTFEISGLTEGKSYVLTVRSRDNETQLRTMKGVVGAEASLNTQELDAKQQRLADLMESDDSLTWLFMGDSITHGLIYSYGYANTPQTVEKYLKDVLGRDKDVVINTAVSSATTQSTLNNIEQRLTKYAPDVVAIMLGTNDAAAASLGGGYTKEQYETNLRALIAKVKEVNENAVIILRSPTPMTGNGSDAVYRRPRTLENIEVMKAVAEDLDLIYVDQYDALEEALTTYSWLGDGGINGRGILGNFLHPGPTGLMQLGKMFIKGCGLWTQDSELSNLFYDLKITEAASDIQPDITSSVDRMYVSITDLGTKSGMSLGAVTVTATANGISYRTTADAGETSVSLTGLPTDKTYEVEVSAYLTNEAKHVTFAAAEVTLSADDGQLTFEAVLSDSKTENLAAGAVVGTLSVNDLAPEGSYTYVLCEGEGDTDNALFEIVGTELKLREALTEGRSYSVRVRVSNGTDVVYKVFTIEAVGSALIFEKSDQVIAEGSYVDLTEEYGEEVLAMDGGSFIVEYTSASSYVVQSLISAASSGASNNHFHLYIQPSGVLAVEIRNPGSFNYSGNIKANSAVRANQKNIVAFKADPETKEYKLFANGSLVASVNADSIGGYKFINDIGTADSVWLGATNRGYVEYKFGGTIHNVKVYASALSDEELIAATTLPFTDETPSGSKISEMFAGEVADISWVFTGGADVKGGFEQTRGERNYAALFERYDRGGSSGSFSVNRQRFVVNAGKAGQTLSDIVASYDTRIAAYAPKAAVYLVGSDDWMKGEAGLTQFKEDLTVFIEKSLDLRENDKGFAVIEKPFAVNSAAGNQLIEKYCEAADEVLAAYRTEETKAKYDRIAVIDHYTNTKTNTNFLTNGIDENGRLTAAGHMIIGRQFTTAVSGCSESAFNSANAVAAKTEQAMPDRYLDVMPTVTAAEASLNVVIPEGNGTEWAYELDMDGVTVSGTAASNSFAINGLTAGKAYVLKLQSADGETQLTTVRGTVTAGETAVKDGIKESEMDKYQLEIAEKIAGDKPLTWLFMGDSITHATTTGGYDGVVQVVEDYVANALGRTDDIVVNAGVNNATTEHTIEQLQYRLVNYKPDILAIQLGTNDAIFFDENADGSTGSVVGDRYQSGVVNQGYTDKFDKYRAEMQEMIDTAREINPDVTIILRSPTPSLDGRHVNNRAIDLYVAEMKAIAEKNDCMFIDQYTDLQGEIDTYSWMRTQTNEFFFTDTLHPGTNGHRIMAQWFIKACGLWTEDSPVTNLLYQMPFTQIPNNYVPEIDVDRQAGSITLSVDDLKEESSVSLGQVILTAVSEDSQQSYSATAKEGTIVLENLLAENYEVTVSAYATTSAQRVEFKAQTAILGEKVRIACVGDSLTEGYTSSGGNKGNTAYPARLQAMLGDGYDVRNFGKTSYALMKNNAKSYWNTQEFTDSKAFAPDIVIIMLGTNDSKTWNEATFKADAADLVNVYKNLPSQPQVIFATSPACFRTEGNDITAAKVDVMVEAQRELIAENGWDTIDMYAKTADRPEMYNTDGVHFTDAGYNYVAQCIYNELLGIDTRVEETLVIPHTEFTYSQDGWTISDAHSWSATPNAANPENTWYEVEFTGHKIDVYSGKNHPMGFVEYFIDGESVGTFDLYRSSNVNSTYITTIDGLEEGTHTFKAVATGEKNASATNTLIDAAELVVYYYRVSEDARLHGTIVDENLQYTADKINTVKAADVKEETLTAWKNDTVYSEISLAAVDSSYENVTVTASDFVSGGNKLDKANVELTFIKSVEAYTGMPGYGSTTRPVPTGSRAEANEVLYQDAAAPIAIESNKLQNVWVSVNVPKDAAAGTYTGTITVEADGSADLTFTYTLEVADAVLADAEEFGDGGFDIELWQNPYRIAEYYDVVPFSEEHFEILKPHMELYKEAGGYAITASIVEEAWAGQTYGEGDVKFPSMVDWTKKADGTWEFDYTDFDAWISFCKEELGIGSKIVCYSIAPWTNAVVYYDEAAGQTVTKTLTAGTEEWTEIWTAFLNDLADHMVDKGWYDDTYIGIDERGFSQAAFDLIDSVTRGFPSAFPMKTAGAMDAFTTKRDLALRLDVWSVGSTAVKAHPAEFEALRQQRDDLGLVTTVYTCTGHAPGSFALSAPGESYWTMMYAYSVGTTGYMRWAYDSWTEEPLTDATHNAFEAGDCFLVYPDEKDAENPVSKSTTRFEKMKEGVRDVNKLMQMKEEVPSLAGQIDALMGTIEATYATSGYYLSAAGKAAMAEDMAAVKETIAEMTEDYVTLKANGTTEVESVTITGEVNELLVGGTVQLQATVLPATLVDNTVTWTSNNLAVATVNNGLVTAVNAGIAVITATSNTDETKKDSITITVTELSIEESAQVAYYSFDDGTAKDSWGTRNGIMAASAAVADGKSGNALSVTEAGQGVTFADDLTALDAGDWTVSYWVYTTSSFDQEISISEDTEKKFSVSMKMAAGKDSGYRVGDGSGDVLTNAYPFEANKWYHITWVQDKSEGYSLFVNGVQNGGVNYWTKNNNVKAPVDIIGGTGFTGLIDEVKIYNKPLTAAEIAVSMKVKGLNIADTDPTVYVGDTYQIVTNLVSDHEDKTITFESKNPEIASVSETGLVTALKRGKAVITVTNAAGGYSEDVTVNCVKQLYTNSRIEQYELPDEYLTDIEKAPGTDRQYLGQPDMIRTNTGRLITAYPVGHGHGPIVMRISDDNGETWTEKTDIPASWADCQETPTLYVLNMADGSEKLILISACPNWDLNKGGWETSISEDNGETWTEYAHFWPTLNGSKHSTIVAMCSLIQLKDEDGNYIEKWMGVYHNASYVNYKTYLTFDENGNEQWSEPEPYLSEYRSIENSHQICEVGLFRSPDGSRIVGLARSQSHAHLSTMFYSDDEGETWSEPIEMQGSLAGERHKAVYDPISGRLVITFREIRYGERIDSTWMAGEWVAWVGTYEDLMEQNEGQYRILIEEDWAQNAKSGDTGYAGIVVLEDGTFIMDSYGHFDQEFSENAAAAGGYNVRTDLCYIKQAKFKLGMIDNALGLVDRSELQANVNEVKDTVQGNYTGDSYAAFEEALAAAQAVLADEAAQQIQIDEAMEVLEAAYAALTEEIPPVEECKHTEVETVNAKAATCTEEGYTGDRKCKACGEILETGTVIEALGHDWSEWTVVKEPTEDKAGEKARVCSRCDAKETESIPATGVNSDKDQSTTPSQPTPQPQPSAPATGDSAELTLWCAIVLAAAAGMIYTRKKRKA